MTDLPPFINDYAYSKYRKSIEKEVLAGDIPRHIAVIMDGNRRYAKEVLGTDNVTKGHEKGKEKLREVADWCLQLGIRYLTAYAFSTENFGRDKYEVDYLMDSLAKTLFELGDDEKVHKNRMSIRVIGDIDLLPEPVRKGMEYAYEKTKGYDDYHLTLAIAYGSRQDIITAVRGIAKDVKDGAIDIDSIDEDLFKKYISTGDMPDPDLVIRTSGEIRISNFLLWEIAYSEFYFVDAYWPEFRYIDLLRAVRTYQKRTRRYGK